MRKLFSNILVILLIAIIVISSYLIYKELKGNKEQEEIFDELVEIVEDNNNDDETERNLSELYNLNNDLVGWIYIEGTNIDYPVMQNKSYKDYYLHRNFYKEYSSYGTPYIAEFCNIQTSDNLIIYGHHMMNNKMFGSLENYRDYDFYKKYNIIEFETLEEVSYYEIIAVFKTVAYSSKGFKYYNFYNAESEEQYNEFINKCKELSFYDTGVTANYGDKLITLSTCEYTSKNGRLVVVAKKLPT